VVALREREAAGDVADQIIADRDVLGDAPGTADLRVRRPEDHRPAGLRGHRTVLEHIALDQDPAADLELDQVLRQPRGLPGQRLGDLVLVVFYLCGHTFWHPNQ